MTRIAAILLTLLALSGCSDRTAFYLIDGTDLMIVDKDTQYTAPQDGFFVSNWYMKEAMGVDVE